jgi:hypothetical protein
MRFRPVARALRVNDHKNMMVPRYPDALDGARRIPAHRASENFGISIATRRTPITGLMGRKTPASRRAGR